MSENDQLPSAVPAEQQPAGKQLGLAPDNIQKDNTAPIMPAQQSSGPFDFGFKTPEQKPPDSTQSSAPAPTTGFDFGFKSVEPVKKQEPQGWFHENVVAPLSNAAAKLKDVVLENEGPGWLPYDIAHHFGYDTKPVPPPATDQEATARLRSRIQAGENQNPQFDQQTIDSEKRQIDRIRADASSEQRNAKQYSEGGTRLLSPEKLLTPEEKRDNPYLYGVLRVAGSLTDQDNLLLMAGSMGLGTVAGAASTVPKLGVLQGAVAAVPRIVSAYFAGQMAIGTAQQIPGLVEAKKEYDKAVAAGDQTKADLILWNIKEQSTEAAASAYMAYAAAYHASTGAPEPVAKAVASSVKETAQTMAETGVQAIRNIPEVAKATVEGAKAAVGYTADKLGPMIGRTNDFETAIARASRITPKQAAAHKEKIADVSEDLQAIANANPDIDGPKEFADKIREANRAEEAKMQQAAGATRDSKAPVVPDAEKRLRDHLNKFFDDIKGKFAQKDVDKAIQDILDHFLQQDELGPDNSGNMVYSSRVPNLYEAENVRQGLNDLTRPQFATNAQPTTSAFKAGAMQAANVLREMIDEGYHASGVEGVKEFRSKEAKRIDVANALEAAQDKADKMGEGGIFRSLMKKIGVPSTVIAIALGHPISGAAIGAAVLGDQIAQNVGNPNVNVERALDLAAKNPNAAATTVTERPQGAPPSSVPPPTPQVPPGVPPVNHKLYSALSSHYGKIIGAVPFDELEDRFMADVQAANERGGMSPEQKQLLGKINDAKADARVELDSKQQAEAEKAKADAEKAQIDQQKAAEKAKAEAEKNAAEAEKEREEKEKLGLKTNLASPFETESHIHPDDERALHHELGHHFQVAKAGHPTHDIIGRLHDQIDPGAEAEARWSPEAFLDDEGNLKMDYLRDHIGELLDIFHGGAVADEVMNGVPVHKNAGAKTDMFRAKAKLLELGFSPSEAGQLMAASEARVRKDFTAPGVRDIFQRYSQAREAGLHEGLLMNSETSGRAIQEFKDALEGTNETNNKPTPVGKGGGSNTKSQSGGTSRVPPGSAERARPAQPPREGAGGSRELRAAKAAVAEPTYQVYDPQTGDVMSSHTTRKGARRRADKLDLEYGGVRYGVREQAAPIRAPQAEDLKTNKAAVAPPEKSTGNPEFDAAIKAGGGVPGGISDFKEFGKIVNFHDPLTGSTLGFKEGKEITPETVRAQIQKSREAFGIVEPNDHTKGHEGEQ